MLALIQEHGLEFFFGTLSAVLAYISLRYTIKDHRAKTEGIVNEDKKLTVFLSRESTLTGLAKQYKNAEATDTIWGQCVSCRGYSPDVRDVVLKAASRGVSFKIISNSAVASNELKGLFSSLKAAEVKDSTGYSMNIHGLSDKEVIVSFSGLNSYLGLRVREPDLLRIIKADFDNRWKAL